MKLLKISFKDNNIEILGTGTQEACDRELELLTIENEQKKIWMVNEVFEQEKNKTVKQFATEKSGHIFDLVVCEEQQVPSYYVEY